MIRLFGLFAKRGMGPPAAAEFTWFYSVKANKNDDGFYYLLRDQQRGYRPLIKSKRALVARRSLIFSPQRFSLGHIR